MQVQCRASQSACSSQQHHPSITRRCQHTFYPGAPGLLISDNKRPDGLTLVPWKMGRCMVWDATVPDTLAPSHISATSKQAGAAANKASTIKEEKYKDILKTHIFIPIAIETLGSLSQGHGGLSISWAGSWLILQEIRGLVDFCVSGSALPSSVVTPPLF